MDLEEDFEIQNVFHLVGEQTLPVYLAAKQFRPEARHYLLTSKSQKTELTARRLHAALTRHGLKSDVVYLGDESIAVSYRKLLPALQTAIRKYSNPGNAVFEMTGGTKLMAFAALVTANQEKLKAVYVDTRGKKLLCLNRENEEYDLTCDMSIKEFITLNGMNMKPGRNLTVSQDFVRYMNGHCHFFQGYQCQFAKSLERKTANPKQVFQAAFNTMRNKQQATLPEWSPAWEAFCKENGIQKCGREYSFVLNGKRYILGLAKARVSDAVSQQIPIKAKIKMPIVRVRATKGEVIPIYEGLKEGKTIKEIKQSLVVEKVKEEVKINREESVIDKQSYLNKLLKGR